MITQGVLSHVINTPIICKLLLGFPNILIPILYSINGPNVPGNFKMVHRGTLYYRVNNHMPTCNDQEISSEAVPMAFCRPYINNKVIISAD